MTTGGPFSRRRLATSIEALDNTLAMTVPFITGQRLFVCSEIGTDSATNGTTPTAPLATLGYALSLLPDPEGSSAYESHAIICMSGHAETVSGAAYISCAKKNVQVIGLGTGRGRPTFTWTATASQIILTGTNIRFQNICFDLTGIDAVVAGFLADAANDLQFIDCDFITNSDTAGVVSAVTIGTTTACDRVKFIGCRFYGPATNSGTTTTAQITLTKGVDYEIRDCYFTGKMTQAITNGAAILRGWIHDNVFVVATGTKAINMHASSTPMISNNRINVPSGTAPIVAAAGFVAGNIYSAAAGVTAGTASTI